MNDIRLCIFDMDGTLMDTEKRVWLAGEVEIAKALGYGDQGDFFRSVLGLGFVRLKELSKEHFGKDFDENDFMARLYAHYENVVENGIVPIKKGGRELLAYLKENNIRIALGTSTSKKHVEMILKKNGIYEDFDSIVCCDDVSHGKPHPETFLKSAKALLIPPENCLVLEDSPNGLKTALNAAMKCIIVKDICPCSKHDLNGARAVLDDFYDVIALLERSNNSL